MAGADYYSCDGCGRRTFYDAGIAESYPDRVGQMIVICPDCAKTMKVVLQKKTKNERKRRARDEGENG